MEKHKTGYAAILGLPNVGKSTLLNALLKQKLSITTSKPQTTRKKILGILSEKNYQIIFLDTPGILDPKYLLQEKMIEEINSSLVDADVFILLIDAKDDEEGKKALANEYINKNIFSSGKKKILVINKVDLITQEATAEMVNYFEKLHKFDAVIPAAANLSFNVEKILNSLIDFLPEGPALYPKDIAAEQTERFFVAELIREKLFEQYRDEIPYSCEVLITDFKEREKSKDYISAEIVVEKEGQKSIIIGKGGTAIKKLGEDARKSVEEFLEREVFLELRVKVRKKWRSDEKMLKAFGYLTLQK